LNFSQDTVEFSAAKERRWTLGLRDKTHCAGALGDGQKQIHQLGDDDEIR
jgi:hypothetical protein